MSLLQCVTIKLLHQKKKKDFRSSKLIKIITFHIFTFSLQNNAPSAKSKIKSRVFDPFYKLQEAVFPVNMPDPIRKHFGYGQL